MRIQIHYSCAAYHKTIRKSINLSTRNLTPIQVVSDLLDISLEYAKNTVKVCTEDVTIFCKTKKTM